MVVPADTPQTPLGGLIVPTEGVLLTHVPPGVVLLNVAHWPIQVVGVPVITAGNGLHVATVVSEHVVGKV